EEQVRVHLQLPDATARKQRDDGIGARQAQALPRLAAGVRAGRLLCQRMADVRDLEIGAPIALRLEGKEREQTIDATRDLRDALGAPCPNGGAHQMQRTHPRTTQATREAQVEIRRIDADEQAHFLAPEPTREIATQSQEST